eukprot:2360737-Rhodomonas_salina.1
MRKLQHKNTIISTLSLRTQAERGMSRTWQLRRQCGRISITFILASFETPGTRRGGPSTYREVPAGTT